MTHALNGTIIQVDVRDLYIGRQAGRIDGKAVILTGDADAAIAQIFDRLIASTVTKLELEGFATIRVTQQLMPQADAKDRLLPIRVLSSL